MVRGLGVLLGAVLVAGGSLAAQYPGGMGGGRMGGGRRSPMMRGSSGPDLPTEPELEGPPDLQTLSLSADIDTAGLAGYGGVVTAYLDSTRAARDSVWIVLQRMRPGADGGTASAPATGDSGGYARGGAGDRQGIVGAAVRIWDDLKKKDAEFEKKVLKPALAKKDFKKWKKWHDDEVDQARKDRDARMQHRRAGMSGGGDIGG